MAAEQGRDVYAVPGNIDCVASFGANKLIRDGAMPLVILDDIMEDLGVTPRQSEKVKACLGGAEKRIYDMLLQNGEMTLENSSTENNSNRSSKQKSTKPKNQTDKQKNSKSKNKKKK